MKSHKLKLMVSQARASQVHTIVSQQIYLERQNHKGMIRQKLLSAIYRRGGS
jgi:hypothetical protein